MNKLIKNWKQQTNPELQLEKARQGIKTNVLYLYTKDSSKFTISKAVIGAKPYVIYSPSHNIIDGYKTLAEAERALTNMLEKY